MGNAYATPLAPGQNFDLAPFRLQTFDADLKFKQIDVIETYQDAYFFSDPKSGAMTFRVPSGAGHTAHSEFPRVELRARQDWTMAAGSQDVHAMSVELQVLAEPTTGELIFAQIHGERSGGSEALKMRWSHGDIVMGVKKHDGDPEERITLLRGVQLGSTIDCKLAFSGDTLNVHVRSGEATASHQFQYAADSWKKIPVYYKVGVYSQDKDADASVASMAVRRLTLGQ